MSAKPIGIQVFPSRISERIRTSDALIHYRITKPMAPDEPPIDYEINDGYTSISYIPSRPQATPVTVQKILISTQKTIEKPRLSNSSPAMKTPMVIVTEPIKQRQPKVIRRPIDTVNESRMVLHDLDQVLEQDEQMSFEEIRRKIKAMNLTFRQYASMPTFTDDPPVDYAPILDDNREPRPHAEYMDGEKSTKYPSNVSAPTLHEEVIGDLKKMPDGIGSLGAIQKEQRRKAEEMERRMLDEIAEVKRLYTSEYFLGQVPTHFTRNPNLEIPRWKRLLMAQKIAQQAIIQQEESIRDEYERWKQQYAPRWRN